MEKMKLSTILLTASVAYGAVGNMQVRGVTSTQAILAYTAPDTNPCTVVVSESPSYSPLVHDVDPGLFAGSNLDSREGAASGTQRVFVAGKRRAEKGGSGRWYSRALQAFTTHYYRVTCGGSQASGSFLTGNIALGNTYNEALPPDPAVSTRPYFSSTGSYAWPEFLNWNNQDAAARQEAVIDPQTGMLLKRLALPQDQPINYLPGGGDHYFYSVLNPSGGWTVPTAVWSTANGKLVSLVVGSGSATVTTSTVHNLTAGSIVTLSGLTGGNSGGNGVYAVTNVPSSTTFQIGQGGLPANTTPAEVTLGVTASAVSADAGLTATFSGTDSNTLFLRDQTLWVGSGTSLYDLNLPTEFITVQVKGWCSGNCAGEDAKIQACLTINGVTCWPTNAAAKYQEVTLGTSATSSFVTVGTEVPILDAWTPAGYSPLNRADISSRMGRVNVDAGGVATWQTGGYPNTYFSPNWTAGSRISIAGSECAIVSVGGLTKLTIDPASCSTTLSLPLTGASYAGSSFGFLLRKKTASTDQINVKYAKYTTGTSLYVDYNASGSATLCSNTLTQNTATGGLGYHCVIPSGWPLLYWVDRKTGDATYLGRFTQSGASGPDGFASGFCDGSATLVGTTPTVPENFFCTATDNETPAKTILVSCVLTTTNQTGNQSTSCANITPGTAGKDILTLVAQFTAGDVPAFDSAKYGCGISGLQGTKLILSCGRSVQDTLGWTVVFDPKKVDTAAGCVGGGAPGCVVAAASTWATAPARWCVRHTTFTSGKTDTVWVAGKYFSPNNPPQLADGPYTSLILSGALSATPSIAAGTGACPAGSAGCDQVTVDGEPCDPTPAAGEATGNSVCPKNPAWVYLQDTKVGDVLTIDAECVVLVAKNGNQWTLRRGYCSGTPDSHGSSTLTPQCMARDFFHGISNWSWTWDTARDPHGLNSDGTTVLVAWDYDHPVPRPDVTVGGMPSYDSNCQSGGGGCYAVRDGTGSMGDPPNRYVTLAPKFSGASGTAAYVERAQDHPSRLQDNASSAEKQWFTDGRPLTPLMDISDAASAVSGQLYRLTSTTTDGDNLHRVGDNIYVVKTSPTTLVAAGNCTAASPCPIWNDTFLVESIAQSCTITLLGGTGTVYISRVASGGLGATYTSGMAIGADHCMVSAGTGFPGGATPMWVWGANAGVWAASGADNRADSSAFLGTVNRKIQPTWAYCGMQPLLDASSAATGDVISDTTADSYKYCVARKYGECRAAAQPGDIYVNCPNEVKRNDGSYGCMWYSQNQDIPVDICVGNMSAYLNSIVQVGFKKNDFTGALGRTLSKGLTRYKIADPYWHGKSLPDASWVMFRSMYTNGAWTDILLGKLPPYPPLDSVVRSEFQPMPVKLTPPAGLAVNNAVIQFGYTENGSAGQFYCTTRQEKCLATAATVPTVPFLFPSEGAGGVEAGVSGVPCASGCTVAIPAISQRILYYQVKYRNAANATVATSQIQTVAIP
jgi:hypothetical protein